MKVIPTKFTDCFIIEPKVFRDDRGYFFESFNQQTFEEKTGLKVNFVQDNQSFSTKGVLRGLHFQKGNAQQAKLIRVIQGKILDVIVDLRAKSTTYGQYMLMILDDQSYQQLFIPRGFAHGFLVLSETVIFSYKCDNFYSKSDEGGIIYNDPDLSIDWPKLDIEFIVSEKDKLLPSFKEIQPL